MMVEPFSEVRRLSEIAFPRFYKHKYMMALTAYLDETGDTDDPNCKFVGIAGLIATSVRWEQFEIEWKAILAKYNLPFFHMKDFAHSRKDFKGWGDQESKRRELYGELLGAIRNAYALPFGTTIPLEPYRSYPKEIRDIPGNHPYYLSFLTCTVMMADLIAPARPLGEKIAPVFADLDGVKQTAHYIHDVLANTHHAGDLLYSPVFRPMREFVPLQAADLVAYETYKEANRRYYKPDNPLRWGWAELIRISRLSAEGFTPFIFQSDDLVHTHMRNAVNAEREAHIKVTMEMEAERAEREQKIKDAK